MRAGDITIMAMRRISGGEIPDDFPWDRREIQAAAGQARDAKIKLSMFESGSMTEMGYAMFPELLAVYFCDVKCDTVRNRYYADLPAAFLGGLPENKGLFQVSFVKDEQSTFKQAKPDFAGAYTGLDAFNEIGITYWPEGERKIWFQNWSKTNPQQVMVKMVPRVEDLDEDDDLPMPADLLQQVIDDVVQRYLPRMPQDNLNDSKAATPAA